MTLLVGRRRCRQSRHRNVSTVFRRRQVAATAPESMEMDVDSDDVDDVVGGRRQRRAVRRGRDADLRLRDGDQKRKL